MKRIQTMTKEYSHAANMAAKRIMVTTDNVSKSLNGPRFAFQEYIDELADIIQEEIDREKNEVKVQAVEDKLDGKEVARYLVEITVEKTSGGWPKITSVVCDGKKMEGCDDSSGRSDRRYFPLLTPDWAGDEYILSVDEVQI
jgi:hypothetical protein